MDNSDNKCVHFNSGYCKFNVKGCKFFHPTEDCSEDSCIDKKCNKRHPRKCKFEENCRYNKKGKCSYKHQDNLKQIANGDYLKIEKEMKDLQNEIVNIQKNIKIKDIKIDFLENKLIAMESHVNETFKKMDSLNIQLSAIKNSINQTKYFQCKQCDFLGKTAQSLEHHITTEHQAQNKLIRKTVEANKMVKCNDCEFEVQNESDMNNHRIANHIVVQTPESIKLSCKMCKTHFESKTELEEHWLSEILCKDCKKCLTSVSYDEGQTFVPDDDENEQCKNHNWILVNTKCDQCYYNGKTEVALSRHKKTKHRI